MAFLKTELRSYLLSKQSVTDIVKDRIYNQWTTIIVPRPYIIMQRSSLNIKYNLLGDSKIPFDSITLMLVSDDSTLNEELSSVISSELSGLQRVTLQTSIFVSSVFLQNVSDSISSPQDDSEGQRFIISHDYDFIYRDLSV